MRAEFDASALTLSRLNATRLIVRFADGTLIDTELADILPPVRDVSDVMQDSVEVLLALPLLSASGGNLDDGQESARPRRWRAEQVTVQELAGHERSELHQDPSRHPELLYRELARLAGSLLTFSLEHHLEAIPATGMPRQSRYSRRCLPCWIRCSKSACPQG